VSGSAGVVFLAETGPNVKFQFISNYLDEQTTLANERESSTFAVDFGRGGGSIGVRVLDVRVVAKH